MSVRAQCLVLLGRWTTAARAADALLENDPEFLKGRSECQNENVENVKITR